MTQSGPLPPRKTDYASIRKALTIVVATAFHSEEELRKHKPAFLFGNLKDYKQVLRAIG
jgi:hypothetical protein